VSITESQKDEEEEVVQIINQFYKGDLNVNAEPFTPSEKISKKILIELNPDEVVDIIKKDY
jgi:hypothetical protein